MGIVDTPFTGVTHLSCIFQKRYKRTNEVADFNLLGIASYDLSRGTFVNAMKSPICAEALCCSKVERCVLRKSVGSGSLTILEFSTSCSKCLEHMFLTSGLHNQVYVKTL